MRCKKLGDEEPLTKQIRSFLTDPFQTARQHGCCVWILTSFCWGTAEDVGQGGRNPFPERAKCGLPVAYLRTSRSCDCSQTEAGRGV